MADEYKINVKDVDDTSSTPSGAYYIPTDDLGSGGGGGGSELPAVTSDDNGDVLTVVEGAWAKADPPSSLPTVTSDDNGDVLTVVEGAWAKAAPSGGVLVITADPDTETLNHTWQEIHDAAFPVMVSGGDEEKSWYPCMIYVEDSEYCVVVNDFANDQNWLYITDAASGYPVFYDPESPVG